MDRWIEQLDGITAGFIKHFGSLTHEELNWKPEQGSWNITQIIEHIIIINTSYFPVLDKLRSGQYKTPLIGRFGFAVSLMGNMLLKAVDPDRKVRTKTFPIWQPDQNPESADILERFKSHQEALKVKLKKSEDLVKSGAVISSPANKNIVYTLEKAFDILVAHEHRHLNQAREILLRMREIPPDQGSAVP